MCRSNNTEGPQINEVNYATPSLIWLIHQNSAYQTLCPGVTWSKSTCMGPLRQVKADIQCTCIQCNVVGIENFILCALLGLIPSVLVCGMLARKELCLQVFKSYLPYTKWYACNMPVTCAYQVKTCIMFLHVVCMVP